MKTCSKCDQTKSVSEFESHPKTKDKLRGDCKSCRRSYMRQRRTGWSPEAFDAAWEAQQGCCDICGVQMVRGGPSAGRYAVHADHCHKTGQTRSLLCCNCNQGLGKFFDNTDLLRRAAEYLERHTL